jgi:hypothetical protein
VVSSVAAARRSTRHILFEPSGSVSRRAHWSPAELEKVETAFINILGLKPLYFRPPYGSINDLALQVLADRGYKKVFLWSDDIGESGGYRIRTHLHTYTPTHLHTYTPTHIHTPHTAILTSKCGRTVLIRLGDANGESVSYSDGVYWNIINDYPNPHLVLDHSTIQTSESDTIHAT